MKVKVKLLSAGLYVPSFHRTYNIKKCFLPILICFISSLESSIVPYEFYIAGNMKIADLSSDQVKRLIKYVNGMLSRFKDSDAIAPSGDSGQNQMPDKLGNLVQYS